MKKSKQPHRKKNLMKKSNANVLKSIGREIVDYVFGKEVKKVGLRKGGRNYKQKANPDDIEDAMQEMDYTLAEFFLQTPIRHKKEIL